MLIRTRKKEAKREEEENALKEKKGRRERDKRGKKRKKKRKTRAENHPYCWRIVESNFARRDVQLSGMIHLSRVFSLQLSRTVSLSCNSWLCSLRLGGGSKLRSLSPPRERERKRERKPKMTLLLGLQCQTLATWKTGVNTSHNHS